MRKLDRLRLFLFCCYGWESPTLRLSHCRVVHSNTLCPVETMAGPSKIHCKTSLALRITCLSPSSLVLYQRSSRSFRCFCSNSMYSLLSFFIIYFWWTWRDSNPRPRHFSLCFVQPYFGTPPGTRTLTNGFGDHCAANYTRGILIIYAYVVVCVQLLEFLFLLYKPFTFLLVLVFVALQEHVLLLAALGLRRRDF